MEEKKDRKLETRHLEAIRDISTKSNNALFELGKITNLIYSIKADLIESEVNQESILNRLSQLEEESTNLVKELKDYYGEGEINPETGIFSPSN